MAQHDTDITAAAPQAEPPLEAPLEEVISISTDLWSQAQSFVDSMFRPWNAYQLLIAIGLFVLAHFLRAILGPRIRGWKASRENWQK